MIEVKDIHKSYNNIHVLKGISLHIPSGKITTIVGASGAGKTTLLQIMASLEKADRGSVVYDSADVTAMREKELAAFRNRKIGLVFQQHRLLPEFTIVENVMMPALIAGKSKSEARKSAEQWLERLGLGHRLTHRPGELSGGECQRASVARAMINRPDVILADEPTGSLDSENRSQIHRIFFDLRDEFGTTFAIVTHDESLAADSDRIVRLKDGQIESITDAEKSPEPSEEELSSAYSDENEISLTIGAQETSPDNEQKYNDLTNTDLK